VFEKQLKPKAVKSIKRKSKSLFIESFRLNSKDKLMSMMLVGLKISSNQKLLQNKNSIKKSAME